VTDDIWWAIKLAIHKNRLQTCFFLNLSGFYYRIKVAEGTITITKTEYNNLMALEKENANFLRK
jgi:hypothetical protein